MHGGKREGAGRKQAPYKTKVMRVPVDCSREIERMVDLWKANFYLNLDAGVSAE